MGYGKIRAVGMGMAMQGSGISGMDVGSATLKLNDDGFYTLMIGAADMGTGCDTTLAQIAAEVLDCPLDNITVFGADTESSPYVSGSYASCNSEKFHNFCLILFCFVPVISGMHIYL